MASLTQLANNEKGFCTHNDMRLVRGGTTHTDPGPGFPYDLYLQYVNEALGITGTVSGTFGNTPPAAPQEDDMQLSDPITYSDPISGNPAVKTNVGALLADIANVTRKDYKNGVAALAKLGTITSAVQTARTAPGATADSVADAVIKALGKVLA